WDSWSAERRLVKRGRDLGITSMLPLLMSPAATAASSVQLRHDALFGATTVLLASERHRRKTGNWPESVQAISSEVLTNPPVDPYSGQPFVFDRSNGRLIVHSIGPNLKDDQGARDSRYDITHGPDDSGATGWDVTLRAQSPPEDS